MCEKITSFDGEFAFLSNFFPCEITWEGITFQTTEAAFQAAKTTDLEKRKEIAELSTPGKAKRAGRKLEIRSDWESIKVSIMEEVLRIKFSQPKMRELLKSTSSKELVEGNTWGDTFWGVCETGQNMLGKLLMKIRNE